MIAHIRGRLTSRAPTHAVVDIGGIGYGLAISLTTFGRLPDVGGEVFFYTHLYVREDRMELYGFAEEDERELFEMLISVSGIGPTLAQTVLSGMSPHDLCRAIRQRSVAELIAIKGIGRKTAERIVLDLEDRVSRHLAISGAPEQPEPDAGQGVIDEAVLALMALGIGTPAAKRAVERAAGRCEPGHNVQDLIKQALKER